MLETMDRSNNLSATASPGLDGACATVTVSPFVGLEPSTALLDSIYEGMFCPLPIMVRLVGDVISPGKHVFEMTSACRPLMFIRVCCQQLTSSIW